MITKESIYKLVDKLNLPAPKKFDQDWEYCVGTPQRLEEFIIFFKNNNLDQDEKDTLITIIIQILNGILGYVYSNDNELFFIFWNEIKVELINGKENYKEIIEYWSSLDKKDIEDCFYITSYMREIYYQYFK